MISLGSLGIRSKHWFWLTQMKRVRFYLWRSVFVYVYVSHFVKRNTRAPSKSRIFKNLQRNRHAPKSPDNPKSCTFSSYFPLPRGGLSGGFGCCVSNDYGRKIFHRFYDHAKLRYLIVNQIHVWLYNIKKCFNFRRAFGQDGALLLKYLLQTSRGTTT